MEVVCITSKRRVSYIASTLSSYRTNCDELPRPKVYCEPGSRIFRGQGEYELISDLRRVRSGRVWGLAKVWCNVLLHATDDVLIFEDDVYWQYGSGRQFYSQICKAPNHLISAYTAYPNGFPFGGWHMFDSPIGLCGSMAMYVPRRLQEPLIRYILTRSTTWALDAHIGDFAMSCDEPLWLHTPTLVLHMGRDSKHVPFGDGAISSPNRAPCLMPLSFNGPLFVQKD